MERIGIPAGERAEILAYFDGDAEGLRTYLLYRRAEMDDRHEYLD